jgi:Fe-S cluster assembly ATP-binding protein
MAAQMGTLAVESLTVRCGDRTLVRDFSLKIGAGELHGLLGPNGAGKSSLLKTLAGHPDYIPVSGDCFLDGQPLEALGPDERARRGLFLAFQSPVELPGVSIGQLLRTARQMRLPPGEPLDVLAFYEELYALLEELGLDRNWATRGANEGFSGGEKKRCELLQLLMLRPLVALLDEIDSGLDVDAMGWVARIIQKLRRGGTAIVLVTHHPRFLFPLDPDRVHVMEGGKLVRSGDRELARAVDARGFGQ